MVTEMMVYSDEYFSYLLSEYSALGYGKVNYDITESDREFYKKLLKKPETMALLYLRGIL